MSEEITDVTIVDPQSTSPLPRQDDFMKYNFFDALRLCLEGEKVSRIEWHDSNTFGFLDGGILKIFIKGEVNNWIVSEGDIVATDWVVVTKKES